MDAAPGFGAVSLDKLDDADFMREALAQAELAEQAGEVPVGAVVVHQGRVVGRGHNRSLSRQDVSAHAEIEALRDASRALGNYRLDDCVLYVTLEPCVMCSGALMAARLGRVVYGAAEPKTGAAGSVLNVFAEPRLNHHTQVSGGMLAEECGQALQTFFQSRRQAQQEDRSLHFLRDDALRLPAAQAPQWPAGLRSNFSSKGPALDGLRLHALQAGEGGHTTLMLLHGPAQWSAAYQEVALQLASLGLAVCAPDLPGFGLSDKPKKTAWHTLERHAAVLEDLLSGLKPNRLIVVAPLPMRPLLARLASMPAFVEREGRAFTIDEPALNQAFQHLPYPDRGHETGPRTLPDLLAEAVDAAATAPRHLSGPDWVEQLRALL